MRSDLQNITMKKMQLWLLAVSGSATILVSCQVRETSEDEKHFIEVIGEHEQVTPDAGYRLNLSYNGPMKQRAEFQSWADSVKKVFPEMMKVNDNIYMNYMPEQTGKPIKPEMYQVGITYMISVEDSAAYGQLTDDLLKHNIPFNLNMTGTFVNPQDRLKLQKQLLAKAVENAKAKLDFLKGSDDRTYEIISIEELDNMQPYGPEYYEYNRRMASRVRVKARLLD